MQDHPTKNRPPSRGAPRPSNSKGAPKHKGAAKFNASKFDASKPGARPARGKAPAIGAKSKREPAEGIRQPRQKIAPKSFSGDRNAGPRPENAPKKTPGAAFRSDSTGKRSGHAGARKPNKARDVEARGRQSHHQDADHQEILALEALGEEAGAGTQRIAKVMARAGACSRRDAEAWIGEGRVALNGVVLTNPAINVGDADQITIDGEPLAQRARTRVFLFHKPRGLVTTERDPEGRPTVFDYLREHWPEGPRVVSIGRLDINTEGLLLLTNDGGLARVLELPSTGWLRRYRVRAKGETDQGVLDRLRQGVTIDGVDYVGVEATFDRQQGANSWLTMGLREGKNREVKRVLEHIGLEVNRLIRLSFGPFQLGELAEGAVDEVRTRVLRDQLGPSLAAAAGADFLSPTGDEMEPPPASEPPRQRQAGTRGGSDRASAQRPPSMRASGQPDRAKETRQYSARPFEKNARESRRPDPQAQTKGNEARGKPAPGPRKHISALRTEDGAGRGARKRIERAETEDRSGRTVRVERLVSTASKDKRQGSREPPTTRNGRRFEAERKNREGESARPARRSSGFSGAEGSRGPKRERSQRPAGVQERPAFGSRKTERDRTSDRPQGPTQYAAKPQRNYEGKRGEPNRGAPEDRAAAPKRPARPAGKTESARPFSAGRSAGGGKFAAAGGYKGGGKPGGKGGPARGAGAGRNGPSKGRPRGKP